MAGELARKKLTNLRNKLEAKNKEADEVEDELDRVNQKIYDVEEDVSFCTYFIPIKFEPL